MMIRRNQCLHAMMVAAALALATGGAQAVAIKNLRGQGLQDVYGTYAPHGDCQREPRVTVDDSGFAYAWRGQTTHSGTLEWAVSYLSQDYRGISRFFFPFPLSDDDFGRVLATVNPDEHAGTLTFEPNLGPGQTLTALQAALVRGSSYAKCGTHGAPPASNAAGTAAARTAQINFGDHAIKPTPARNAARPGALPWRTRTAAGRTLAMAIPIDSTVKTISLFCNQSQPLLAMLVKMRPPQGAVTLTFVFNGWTVNVPMNQGNRDATLWMADLSRSDLPQWLAHRGSNPTTRELARLADMAFLRINGGMQGEISLQDSTLATQAALRACYRY